MMHTPLTDINENKAPVSTPTSQKTPHLQRRTVSSYFKNISFAAATSFMLLPTTSKAQFSDFFAPNSSKEEIALPEETSPNVQVRLRRGLTQETYVESVVVKAGMGESVGMSTSQGTYNSNSQGTETGRSTSTATERGSSKGVNVGISKFGLSAGGSKSWFSSVETSISESTAELIMNEVGQNFEMSSSRTINLEPPENGFVHVYLVRKTTYYATGELTQRDSLIPFTAPVGSSIDADLVETIPADEFNPDRWPEGPVESWAPPLNPKAGDKWSLILNGREFMDFRYCPPGAVAIGSPTYRDFNVELSSGFWMAETETTVNQFQSFVTATGYNTEKKEVYHNTGTGEKIYSTWADPIIFDSDYKGIIGNQYGAGAQHLLKTFTNTSGAKIALWRIPQTPSHPVTNVSWHDSIAFTNWLDATTDHLDFNLSTEAQWEYSCKAGTDYIWNGETNEIIDAQDYGNFNFVNSGNLDGEIFTSPVGLFKANPWGLKGMHGNVSEWCLDYTGGGYPYSDTVQVDWVRDEPDPNSKYSNNRKVRGGNWSRKAEDSDAIATYIRNPSTSSNAAGFRVIVKDTRPAAIAAQRGRGQ